MLRPIVTRRLYSTVYSTVKVKKGSSVRELFYTPVFKSLFLTLVLGSAVVEATKNRKAIDSLRTAYDARFGVLKSATEKIRSRQPVDVAAELKLANSLTRNMYNSVTDVQLDHQFESFLNMAEEDSLPIDAEEPDVSRHLPASETTEPQSRKSSDFL